MNRRKVSVIIPCYNSEKFIAQTLHSVLDQSYNNLEIIVVNDSSVDKTSEIVKSFLDPRIKYFFKVNEGVSIARNYGIKASCGEYIAFLDSDDLWLPQKIEAQVKYLEENQGVYFINSGFIMIDDKNGIIGKITPKKSVDILEDLLLNGNIIGPPSGVLMRRTVLENIGGFDHGLSTSADWDLWLRICKRYAGSCLTEPLFKYRNHNDSMHHNINEQEEDVCKILTRFFLDLNKSDKYYRLKRKAISNAYMVIAKSYFEKGYFGGFLKTLIISIYWYPFSLFLFLRDISNKLLKQANQDLHYAHK